MAQARFVVKSSNGITFIVVDTTTGRNVAFDRNDVPLTFGARQGAHEWAERLNREDHRVASDAT